MRRTVMGWVVAAELATLVSAGPALAQSETQGFLYGTVTMRSGDVYTGRLRWGTEEAFWDDLFNAHKGELPALEHLPRRARRDRRKDMEVFGYRFGVRWDDGLAVRLFACRFGDIREIRVVGDDAADLTLRNGETYEADGGSNDVGTEITVWDDAVGKIALRWNRIDRIEFKPTPAGLRVDDVRLKGKLTTEDGDFEGFIQWDSEEALSSDELNGYSRDGKLDIRMDRIAAIERAHDHCRVELKDGRTYDLDGTNDVDSSIRGILVEDPRYGRIEATWDAFERLEFVDNKSSGRGYDSYAPAKRLRATVTDLDDEARTGTMYFDLDEGETWEFLNGTRRGVEYNIPFSMVRTIVPKGRDDSEVTLTNGETLRLEDGHDVSEENDGILLFVNDDEDDSVYIRWDDVDRIELLQ